MFSVLDRLRVRLSTPRLKIQALGGGKANGMHPRCDGAGAQVCRVDGVTHKEVLATAT